MTDKIASLVERAIAYTNEVLAIDATYWRFAREGLERILDNLELGEPQHPALERLRLFIAEQDELYEGGASRH